MMVQNERLQTVTLIASQPVSLEGRDRIPLFRGALVKVFHIPCHIHEAYVRN